MNVVPKYCVDPSCSQVPISTLPVAACYFEKFISNNWRHSIIYSRWRPIAKRSVKFFYALEQVKIVARIIALKQGTDEQFSLTIFSSQFFLRLNRKQKNKVFFGKFSCSSVCATIYLWQVYAISLGENLWQRRTSTLSEQLRSTQLRVPLMTWQYICLNDSNFL